MATSKKAREHDLVELPNGKIVCVDHNLVVCGKCCVDYSYIDEFDDHTVDPDAGSDDERLLTEEEMASFKASMIAKKGCACLLPLVGSGCQNCDPEVEARREANVKNNEKVKSNVLKRTSKKKNGN